MTDEKCEQLYHQLLELLHKHRFDWVVEQVEAEITLGRTTGEIARESGGLAQQPNTGTGLRGTRGSSSRTTHLKRVELTPRERLVLLIMAIEHAVIHVGDIRSYLVRFVEDNHIERICFVRDVEGGQPRELPVAVPSRQKQASEQLRSLLNQLKTEVRGRGS
jgi:hypothetical protein